MEIDTGFLWNNRFYIIVVFVAVVVFILLLGFMFGYQEGADFCSPEVVNPFLVTAKNISSPTLYVG